MKAIKSLTQNLQTLQLHIRQIVTCSACEGRNFKANMTKVGNGYVCDFCLTDPNEPLNIVIPEEGGVSDVEH